MRRHFDFWSMAVIIFTFTLFVTALWLKGLTHEVFLEAGIFLVSVKLILMSYKNSVMAGKNEERLEQIQSLLQNTQYRADA